MKNVGTLRIGDQGPLMQLMTNDELTIIGPDIKIKEIKGPPSNSGMQFAIPLEYREENNQIT